MLRLSDVKQKRNARRAWDQIPLKPDSFRGNVASYLSFKNVRVNVLYLRTRDLNERNTNDRYPNHLLYQEITHLVLNPLLLYSCQNKVARTLCTHAGPIT